jgi:nucleoside-triphosphatase THEP1
MNIAAILYEGDQGSTVDALLAGIACHLRAEGWKLAGAVQSPTAQRNSRCEMTLEDLATGTCVETTDVLGPSVSGCRLDTEALEDSVGLAVTSLHPDTKLVVINRFGKRETEGRGFRLMIENAVVLDVPVLVGVKRLHLDAWTHFVGGEPLFLPHRRDDILRWCEAAAPCVSSPLMA